MRVYRKSRCNKSEKCRLIILRLRSCQKRLASQPQTYTRWKNLFYSDVVIHIVTAAHGIPRISQMPEIDDAFVLSFETGF